MFPLESLLRLKRQRERMASLRLATARHALEHAQTHLTHLKRQLDRQAALTAERSCREASSEEWTTAAEAVGRLTEAIQATEYTVDHTQKEFNAAREDQMRCAIELGTLVTLKDRQREQHQRLVDRENQIRLHELNQRRVSMR